MRNFRLFFYLLTFISFTFSQTTLEREWVREYTGDFEMQDARSIVIDDSGNAYVGITSFDTISDYGFTIIKYNSSGDVLWISKYEDDDPESNDHLRDIAVDKDGNVYITGSSEFLQLEPFLFYQFFVTIKYNSKGEQQWLVTYRNESTNIGNPNHIAVDSLGCVYVQGNYGMSVLLKYDSSGTKLWERNFDNERVTGYYDKCMVMDKKANIYTADKNFSVVKYDSSGNLIWLAEDDSLKNAIISQSDITVDNNGNVYICGTQYNSDNNLYITAKYNKNGSLDWVKRYGGELYYNYKANGVIFDSFGSVYVSGYVFADYAHDDQFVTIKYDSSGNELWIEKCDGPLNTYGYIWNIGIDNLNNIYIIGKVTDYSNNGDDLALLKYDSNGNLLFSDYYGENGRNEEAIRLATDKRNNVYITGDSYSSKGQKVILLKYIQKPVSIEPINNLLPVKSELYQNYPNPFNSTTTISFTLPKTMYVNLKIYDLLGREVKSLVSGRMEAGYYKNILNSVNLSSGIYFYHLKSEEFTLSRKLLLLK